MGSCFWDFLGVFGSSMNQGLYSDDLRMVCHKPELAVENCAIQQYHICIQRITI